MFAIIGIGFFAGLIYGIFKAIHDTKPENMEYCQMCLKAFLPGRDNTKMWDDLRLCRFCYHSMEAGMPL